VAKILILASNHGLWAEELQAPWDAFTAAGHDLTLATMKGITPLPFIYSMNTEFIDPLLHTQIVPDNVYNRVVALLDSGVWDHPIKIDDANMSDYDVLVIVGGPGAAVDLSGNPKVHSLVAEQWQRNKIVAALCYGVGALAWTRQPYAYTKSVVRGKTIVAHPKEWDYDTAMGYELFRATPENPSPDFITPGFIYPLRAVMEGAVGDEGTVISPPETTRDNPCVHYDHPFVTALSVESSTAFGDKLVELLAGK
jgi:putative intracellular protease/amidase